MPKRALIEKRPWLLASLAFGISYWFVAESRIPGLFLIGWKGAGVALLAVYALVRHPMRDARWLAAIMALDAIGDMVLQLDQNFGGIAFLLGHILAIGLYLSHRRERISQSQRAAGLAALFAVPVIAWGLTTSLCVTVYALALGAMAGAAWTSAFPRYRTGLGAMMFVASDLLIFAGMGPQAGSSLAAHLVWPLYYFGQFLICIGVIGSLHAKVQNQAIGSKTSESLY